MGRAIFIDASFWIAYRDARDPYFERAKPLLFDLFKKRASFVTSLPVFCEIHAHFSRHPAHRKAVIADFWANPVARVELPSFDDCDEARALLAKHQDKSYGFCDALSFVMMQRLELRRAASFDIHFRQFGEFEVIC